jgi:imidazolonepropionase-like amidohydrolase
MNKPISVYHAGWLIDGSGAPARRDCRIVVADRHIQCVISPGESLPAGAPVEDLTDCTVLPALIDSHVHLVMSGSMDYSIRKRQLENAYAERLETIARHLTQHLASGVVAVREGGDHNGDVLRYAAQRPHPSLERVTIAAPGRARHAKGRYGKLIGIPVDAGTPLLESITRSRTRRDHLKLVNSGLNSLTQFGVETKPQFDADELKQTIAAATQQGIPTMVHANGHLPVQLAVEAGCASIEHGFFMGHANMQRMADRGTVWVPTAVTMKAYEDYLKRQGHRSDPSFAEVSRRNLDHQIEQIRLARDMGVILAVGTDAGSPGVHHGSAVKAEIELFIAAGFSVEEAIRCASRNGARLMGMDDRGEIRSGMRADFIAVRTPPEKAVAALHRIVCFVIAGTPVGSMPEVTG